MSKKFVFSLGGSLLYKKNELDLGYWLKAVKHIKRLQQKGFKLGVVTGGGNLAREFIKTGRKLGVKTLELHKLGSEATRMNGHLLHAALGKAAYPRVLDNYRKPVSSSKVLILTGWEYGITSDTMTARWARALKSDWVNLTNVKGIYDRDPKKRGAKLLNDLTWTEAVDLANKFDTREPGMHFPLDHTAAGLLRKHKIPGYIIEGHDWKNITRCLEGKSFVGTRIGS